MPRKLLNRVGLYMCGKMQEDLELALGLVGNTALVIRELLDVLDRHRIQGCLDSPFNDSHLRLIQGGKVPNDLLPGGGKSH